MAKKKSVINEVKKAPVGRLQNGITWNLSDPGMGLLERAGLAALYMSLRTAEELGMKDTLLPLSWNEDDLLPHSVTIRSTSDDRGAIAKLFEWAWQVRDGVLYLPAVHRSLEVRDNRHLRTSSHNGLFATFLQHPNTQPKLEREYHLVELREDREILVSFERPAERVDDVNGPLNPKTKRPHKKKVATSRLRPVEEAEKLTPKSGVFASANVQLSNWVYPGISGRYGVEESWEACPELTLLVMLAPIACIFQQLHNERSSWAFVIPDVRNLEQFDEARNNPLVHGDPVWTDVASLGDAGLRFLSLYQTQKLRRELDGGCQVVAMGKVGYYQSQSIRKGVVNIRPDERLLKRYRILERTLGNRWKPRKPQEVAPFKGKTAKKKAAKAQGQGDEIPVAKGFVSVPTIRGRIADNLIARSPWYTDISKPPQWDLDKLEWQRKRQPGKSIERLWFESLRFSTGALMALIAENDMWDDHNERDFVYALWEVIGQLRSQEAKATERGGSRSTVDRIIDLDESIQRDLMRARTAPLFRSTMTEMLGKTVKHFRATKVQERPDLIWHLIDTDWKRGRDLALLALASYENKQKREARDAVNAAADDEET